METLRRGRRDDNCRDYVWGLCGVDIRRREGEQVIKWRDSTGENC